MNIYVSHAGNYDYENELYVPVKESELYSKHYFFLPHEPENTNIAAKDELKQTDVLMAEVSRPSTGQGIELGLASTMDVRIICFYKAGAKPSSSLRFITNDVTEYSDIADLLAKLQTKLG
jgi:hypothetical protein